MRLFIMPGRSCHDTQKVSFSRCSNSETLLLPALYQHFSVWSREIYRWATFQRGKGKKTSEIRRFQRFLVRVGRLELPASCSQSERATNCATPGYSVFLHDTMLRKKKQVFRVCGHRCGQARFYGSFSTGEFPPQATAPRLRSQGNGWGVYPPKADAPPIRYSDT